MPSVSRHSARLGVLAICGLLLTGAAAGCSTTQEKAEIQQAQAKHILEARAKRQHKKHVDGPQTHPYGGKTAHQPEEGEQ